eukprot:CAMPEP_0195513482 /NCGR_PEP_ID=MMETSP0794_2-20130614/5126_1 /TAXON_ID=515487 /ORGANISM="Stephanopyxis turris, Strain CCMP 815" /LENGTH=206 /DNA_ID=CAMNT_0040641501 /DNA_START=42 /DNA_END=662 /DNA_ORIENTATION=-
MVKLFRAASLLLVSISGSNARSFSSAVTAFVSSPGARRTFGTTAASLNAASGPLPIKGGEEIMSQKAHGTSEKPVQKDLLWGCDNETADRICNFNRHYAEHAGYWQTTKYLEEVDMSQPTKYYDSVTGKLLFTAPVGRSMEAYLKESASHGWPSFRDEEVNWDYVRVLDNGECVSTEGTHLGHNLPDSSGNRYCINLVCIAGKPEE